jgi:hypothetical protein
MDTLMKIFDKLPPLPRRTRPNLACAIGFFTGGIGLALYFRSFVDVIMPIAIVVAIVVAYDNAGAVGWLLGALVAAFYGYFRSESSNRRLADRPAPAPAPIA